MIKTPEKSALSRGAHLSPADQTRAALIRAALKLFGRQVRYERGKQGKTCFNNRIIFYFFIHIIKNVKLR